LVWFSFLFCSHQMFVLHCGALTAGQPTPVASGPDLNAGGPRRTLRDPLNSGWLFGVSGLFSSPDVELKILKDQIDTSDPAQAQNIKIEDAGRGIPWTRGLFHSPLFHRGNIHEATEASPSQEKLVDTADELRKGLNFRFGANRKKVVQKKQRKRHQTEDEDTAKGRDCKIQILIEESIHDRLPTDMVDENVSGDTSTVQEEPLQDDQQIEQDDAIVIEATYDDNLTEEEQPVTVIRLKPWYVSAALASPVGDPLNYWDF